MALRKILLMDKNEAELRRKSKPVLLFDGKLAELIDDLFDTMHSTSDGAGLAAPQVGVLKRVAVIDLGEDAKVELVNPTILEQSGEADYEEGCLSLPGKHGLTKRPTLVKVRAQDRHGSWFELEGKEIMALALVHEIGHLDGELFIDYVVGDLWEGDRPK